VTGKTWWEWVFVGTLAVLHIIRPSPHFSHWGTSVV
jgi:hypothetical protein